MGAKGVDDYVSYWIQIAVGERHGDLWPFVLCGRRCKRALAAGVGAVLIDVQLGGRRESVIVV